MLIRRRGSTTTRVSSTFCEELLQIGGNWQITANIGHGKHLMLILVVVALLLVKVWYLTVLLESHGRVVNRGEHHRVGGRVGGC